MDTRATNGTTAPASYWVHNRCLPLSRRRLQERRLQLNLRLTMDMAACKHLLLCLQTIFLLLQMQALTLPLATRVPVQIGSLPQPGLVYKWTPIAGLSNSAVANPFFTAAANTPTVQTLALQVHNNGGGCAAYDTAVVTIQVMSDSVELFGNAVMCKSDAAAAYLKVFPANKIQWYRNGKELTGENNQLLRNLQTGDYYAVLTSASDCSLQTKTRHIEIYPVPVPDFSVQPVCRNLPLPVTNRTTNNTQSTVNYFWDFGNGHSDNAYSPAYAYTASGTYTVKLKVSTVQCPLSF